MIESPTTRALLADAEQAKSTGGMLALMPTAEDAARYAVPGGEPPEDLHVTLFYFGSEVGEIAPLELIGTLDATVTLAFPRITAQVFGRALFNPDTPDACAVYLVGNHPLLAEIKMIAEDATDVLGVPNLPEQHAPWVPHVTGGYGLGIEDLAPGSEMTFDRVELHWAGDVFHFPFTGHPLTG